MQLSVWKLNVLPDGTPWRDLSSQLVLHDLVPVQTPAVMFGLHTARGFDNALAGLSITGGLARPAVLGVQQEARRLYGAKISSMSRATSARSHSRYEHRTFFHRHAFNDHIVVRGECCFGENDPVDVSGIFACLSYGVAHHPAQDRTSQRSSGPVFEVTPIPRFSTRTFVVDNTEVPGADLDWPG
jgi:hypothetical protein